MTTPSDQKLNYQKYCHPQAVTSASATNCHEPSVRSLLAAVTEVRSASMDGAELCVVTQRNNLRQTPLQRPQRELLRNDRVDPERFVDVAEHGPLLNAACALAPRLFEASTNLRSSLLLLAFIEAKPVVRVVSSIGFAPMRRPEGVAFPLLCRARSTTQ